MYSFNRTTVNFEKNKFKDRTSNVMFKKTGRPNLVT